jgi:hypoxanthine phosphoribosyltransferase
MKGFLVEALDSWGGRGSAALAQLFALEPDPPKVAVRQDKAAAAISYETSTGFRSHKQRHLLEAFADHIESLEEVAQDDRRTHAGPYVFEWTTIHATLRRMHAQIEQAYAPEAVITMSGPGSFAACYYMSLSARQLPVFVCVTFPYRSRPPEAHQAFIHAAEGAGWRRIMTDRWDVFVPNVLEYLPDRHRILVLDDRVLSGKTQQAVRTLLEEELRLEVKCAAMFTNSENAGRLDFVGRIIDEDFDMPWGPRSGRP